MTLMHTETSPAVRRPHISYRTLTPNQAQALQDVIALDSDPGSTPAQIVHANALMALVLGVRLRTGGQLVQCDCENCPDGCDAIYDLDAGSEYLNSYGTQAPQCPSCHEDHPQGDA